MYTEEFKQVIIHPHEYMDYLISSFGRLFVVYRMSNGTYTTSQVETYLNKKGYEITVIYGKGYTYNRVLIHRLVAKAFIKNKRSDQNQVNHINGVKTDNYIWNLEWNTPKENVQHAWKNGLVNKYGINANNNKYTEKQIHTVCQMLQDNYRVCDISKHTDVDTRLIYYILAKHNWLEISNQYDFSKFGSKPKMKLINQ